MTYESVSYTHLDVYKRQVSAYCDGAEERNCLRPLFRALTPDRTLEDSITGSIISAVSYTHLGAG